MAISDTVLDKYILRVGDEVIIEKQYDTHWNGQGLMDKWIGTTQIISEIDPSDGRIFFVNGGSKESSYDDNINSWYWRANYGMLKPTGKRSKIIKKLKFKLK